MRRKILNVALSALLLSGLVIAVFEVFESATVQVIGDFGFMIIQLIAGGAFIVSALLLFSVLFLAVSDRADVLLGQSEEKNDRQETGRYRR